VTCTPRKKTRRSGHGTDVAVCLYISRSLPFGRHGRHLSHDRRRQLLLALCMTAGGDGFARERMGRLAAPSSHSILVLVLGFLYSWVQWPNVRGGDLSLCTSIEITLRPKPSGPGH